MNISYLNIKFAELPNSVQNIVNEILLREGSEYTNDPNDHPTKYGIRRLSANRAGYSGKIENITKREAEQIWTALFWYGPNLHWIHSVSPLIAETVMDTSGPAGIKVGNSHLQECLTAFNEREDGVYIYGIDLIRDGLIGTKTIRQLTSHIKLRGIRGEGILASKLNCLQDAHYTKVAVQLPSKRGYTVGWHVQRVEKDLLELVRATDRLVA